VVRINLEDQGDGWPAGAPLRLTGLVVRTVRVKKAEPYLLVEFEAPVVVQERGKQTPSGLHLVTYVGAWVRSRWVGHSIGPAARVSAFVWLIEQGNQSVEPPRPGQPPDLWAECAVLEQH
jgi:hypothetical protein